MNTPTASKAFIPTAADIDAIRPGTIVIDCLRRALPVEDIHARDFDVKGRAFVCGTVTTGPGSSMSFSVKEGEAIITVGGHVTEADWNSRT